MISILFLKMSSRYRVLRCVLSRVKLNYRMITTVTLHKIPPKSMALPCTVGFSIFTWLGLEKKLSPEDELINTIKHCVLFIQRTEYDKAEQLLHVALRQAQQIQHELGITYIYDVMANLALERQQLDKAQKLFVAVSQRLLANGVAEDDSRVVHISIKLARICHLKKDLPTAELGYTWCLEKLKNLLSTEPSEITIKLLAMAEDWYGRLIIENGNYEEGLVYMITSLNRMKEVPDIEEEHIVIQLNDIGTVYNQMGKSDDSITYFKEAIEKGRKLDMDELGTMYVNLGRAYLKKNLVDDARKHCGYAWRLGVLKKSDIIKDEAEDCLKEIKAIKLTV